MRSGLRIFGVVLWAAAITCVIGASYTTVSFVTSRTGTSERLRTVLVCGFIAFTTLVFVSVGTPPATLLVFAGAFNGLLLPFGIGVLLWVAARRADLLRGYTLPAWPARRRLARVAADDLPRRQLGQACDRALLMGARP